MDENVASVYRKASRLEQIQEQLVTHAPLTALLLCYFFLRLFFQQIVIAKTWFIYSTGLVINWFYGLGEYADYEWVFGIDNTVFTLGESCSGTTFFCLLISYLVYRKLTYGSSLTWLLMALPITILANSMRVLSSIMVHNALVKNNLQAFGSQAHTLTGAITFFICFVAVAYVIEIHQTKTK